MPISNLKASCTAYSSCNIFYIKGVFKVTEIKPENNFSRDELIAYAAFAESFSNHLIAISIISAYKKDIDKDLIKNYNEISGHGVKVQVEGKEVLAGNYKLMYEENITYNKIEAIDTIVHVAVDKIYAGYIIISDEVKEDSAKAIKALKELGVKQTVMLNGDNKAKSPKGKLIFVRDGINDALVLARADIGIVVGGVGSDATIEAADVVIMTDEPLKIATAIKVAKKTRGTVMQNIVFVLAVKIVILY